MCLETVNQLTTPSTLIVSGYKFFNTTWRGIAFLQQTDKECKYDTWLRAEGPELRADDGKMYPAGFHVYVEDVGYPCSGTKRRVYARRVIAEGIQDKPVIIAQEIYIPRNDNDWPPK